MSDFIMFEGHPITEAARDAILDRRAAEEAPAGKPRGLAAIPNGSTADLSIEAAKDLDPTVKGSDVLEAAATAEAVAELAQTPDGLPDAGTEASPEAPSAEVAPDPDAAETSPEPDSGDELGGEG